jgi:hypothetical protein
MSGPNQVNFPNGSQVPNPTWLVDASGNQITTFGGGTQYTDAASTVAHPIGTMSVFDNAGTISKVSVSVGLPVNIVGGGGSGGTALADDTTYTAGTTTFTPSGGVYNDAIAAATSGKADGVRISQNRAFHINIRNNAGTELATASNPLQVSLANTAANGTAVAVSLAALPALVAGSAVIGSTTIQTASGTALQADQTNTILKTSLYVKTSAAADTVLALGQAAMAGSLPVTLANNQGQVGVNVSDGAGNALTSNSTTYTAKKALDANILGTLGTAFSTAGKVDVKGADGDVFVRQATAANLNATATVQAVTGTSLAVGSNAMPVLNSAAQGYVAAYGSNAAALTSSTDYSFKWGAGGTTQVNHVFVQNNTALNLNWELDATATAGSPVLAPGQSLFLDVQTLIVHLFQAGTPNVGGSSASNIVVKGWL